MVPSRKSSKGGLLAIILFLGAYFSFIKASNTAASMGGQEQGWSLTLLIKENTPPVGNDDSYLVDQDNSLSVPSPGVLANDNDPGGKKLKAELLTGPGHGVAVLNGDGSLLYTPENGYHGVDTFTYTVRAASRRSAPATVSITVLASDEALVAIDDQYALEAGVFLEVPSPGVLENDYDPQGGALAVTLVSRPVIGVVVLNMDGSFTYTAPGDASGNDEFTYKMMAEGRESNHAKVTITFQNQGGEAPVAQDDNYMVEQNQALDVPDPGILANDYDPRGKKLKVELINLPQGGELHQSENGSFSYTPAGEFAGEDRFTYRVRAASLTSNEATVLIKVLDVTAPTVQWSGEFQEGGIYQVGDGPLLLTASAADNYSLREVVFHRWDAVNENFVFLGSDTQAPYELEIDTGTLNLEWNQVFVKSYDAFNNSSGSPFVWLYRQETTFAHWEFLPFVSHP